MLNLLVVYDPSMRESGQVWETRLQFDRTWSAIRTTNAVVKARRVVKCLAEGVHAWGVQTLREWGDAARYLVWTMIVGTTPVDDVIAAKRLAFTSLRTDRSGCTWQRLPEAVWTIIAGFACCETCRKKEEENLRLPFRLRTVYAGCLKVHRCSILI
jgi:hypothetical protein